MPYAKILLNSKQNNFWIEALQQINSENIFGVEQKNSWISNMRKTYFKILAEPARKTLLQNNVEGFDWSELF